MSLELAVCPVCKTTDFSKLADGDAVRRQVEALWAFHTRRLQPGAPAQQFFDRAVFSQPPPVHIVSCNRCGTVLRNPRETDESLVELYATEDPPAAALEQLFEEQRRFFRSRVRRLERMLGRTGRVLEVASYIGGFLSAANEQSWDATGVDVNENTNAFAQRKGCRILTGTIEDVDDVQPYDVVCFWNVFDQLAEPERALRHARTLLKPKGIVTLRVPNGAFYSSMLGRTHLLAQNNLLAFPYRHGFTTKALHTLLGNTGFEIRTIRGDTLVHTAGPWTKRWAAIEERVVKALTRTLLPRSRAPWLELYAVVV